jgi:Uma2 family endonuclease
MDVKQLLTAEEFWSIPDTPGKRFELVRGEPVEIPAAGAKQGVIMMKLCNRLLTVVSPWRLGHVFGDGVGYILARAPDLVRIPDTSFVARERVPASGIPEGFWPFAPDLAVEFVSPSDRAEELRSKVREYLAAGTRLVWVVWPRLQLVTVHEAGGGYRELGPDDELDGGDLMPGFQVRVADLLQIGSVIRYRGGASAADASGSGSSRSSVSAAVIPQPGTWPRR